MTAKPWRVFPLSEAFWFQEGPGIRNWQFTSEGVKLLNVANIEKGGNLNLAKTSRHLDAAEVASRYSHFLLEPGDFVIASSGITFDTDGLLRTRGAFVSAEHLPLCLNTSTIRFRGVPGRSELGFLRAWLDSLEFRSQISKLVTGSAQQNFGPSHLRSVRISLPSLPEQRRIADILDRAEALRVQRRAAIAELDSLPQAIFLDMFGDPVTNPKNWPLVTVEDICDLVRGSSPRPQGDPRYFGGPVPRLMVADITRDGWLVTPRIDSLTLEGAQKSRPVPAGTVVMAVSGNIGLVSILATDACVHDGFVAFTRLDEAVFKPKFFLVTLDLARQLHEKSKAGAIFINLTTKDVKAMRLPVPPLAEQQEYIRSLELVEKLKTAQKTALAELDALFASLQHRAFRGEL